MLRECVGLALALLVATKASATEPLFLSCDVTYGQSAAKNWVFKLENERLMQYSQFSGSFGDCDSYRNSWRNCKTSVSDESIEFTYSTNLIRDGVSKPSHNHRILINRTTGSFLWTSYPLDPSSSERPGIGGVCSKTSNPAPPVRAF